MVNDVKNMDDLIFELIFSDETIHKIDISEYLKDELYTYKTFIKNIKNILRISKVTMVDERISVDIDAIIWEFRTKK